MRLYHHGVPRDVWVRHRCPENQTSHRVLFNDFGVRVSTLPGVSRGCPFCWADYLRLRNAWWDNYRRRVSVARPEEFAAPVVDAMLRLERPGCPPDVICSHFGVHLGVRGVSVNLAPMWDDSNNLQVTIYQEHYPRPATLHRARAEVVARALTTSIKSTWNGGDNHSGISVVLSRPAPASLVLASRTNYRAQRDVFRPTDAERSGWEAFREWYEVPLV